MEGRREGPVSKGEGELGTKEDRGRVRRGGREGGRNWTQRQVEREAAGAVKQEERKRPLDIGLAAINGRHRTVLKESLREMVPVWEWALMTGLEDGAELLGEC